MPTEFIMGWDDCDHLWRNHRVKSKPKKLSTRMAMLRVEDQEYEFSYSHHWRGKEPTYVPVFRVRPDNTLVFVSSVMELRPIIIGMQIVLDGMTPLRLRRTSINEYVVKASGTDREPLLRKGLVYDFTSRTFANALTKADVNAVANPDKAREWHKKVSRLKAVTKVRCAMGGYRFTLQDYDAATARLRIMGILSTPGKKLTDELYEAIVKGRDIPDNGPLYDMMVRAAVPYLSPYSKKKPGPDGVYTANLYKTLESLLKKHTAEFRRRYGVLAKLPKAEVPASKAQRPKGVLV